MSVKGQVLRHPVNYSEQQTWDGFSWPAFFFGVFWLLVKGLYGHFIVNLLIVILSSGVLAPIVWIVYGFIGNGIHKQSLLKQGYLTQAQLSERAVPSQPVPSAPSAERKDQLTKLRELGELREKGVLTDEEFSAQKARVLAE
jgi:hypothetical protein